LLRAGKLKGKGEDRKRLIAEGRDWREHSSGCCGARVGGRGKERLDGSWKRKRLRGETDELLIQLAFWAARG